MSSLRTLCFSPLRFSLDHLVATWAFSFRQVWIQDKNAYFWQSQNFRGSFEASRRFRSQKLEGIVLRVPEHVRKTNSPDGGIVLDLKHGRMFTLNLVGSKILELLDRQCTSAEITAELAREYGIDTDVAARDVREFLDLLEKRRLIEAHPSRVAL